MVIQDHITKLLIKLISPNRFKVGGAAILLMLSKNHQKLNIGKKFIIPLFINILRLNKRS